MKAGASPLRQARVLAAVALLGLAGLLASATAWAETPAAVGTRWLVVGASEATPGGIAKRARALTAAGAGDGLLLSTADCFDSRPVFAWAVEVASDFEPARAALERLRQHVPDAFIKRCNVRAGSLLALGLPAVHPSIADVPADAVNWSDADRVSAVRVLGAGLSLVLQRYRAALPDDPLEGRRTRLLLVRPGAAPRPLVEDCAGLASAVAGHGWLALACDSEQAADHVLHTVHAFSDSGERVAEVARCRTPRLSADDLLLCQSESVDATGKLKLTPRSSKLARR